MNSKQIIFLVSLFLGIVLISCDDEESNELTISDMELGTSNSHIGIVGSDLHIEAEILAEANIKTIDVQIYNDDADGWAFDSSFTEFMGLKNTTFHKHVDISSEADTGAYTFLFTVTDQLGAQVVEEIELDVQYPNDTIAPVISITSAPSDGETFSTGDTITITGTVTDETSLAGIYCGLVRVGQSLTDAEVNATNTITILHTHDFEDPEEYSFSSSIIVGAEYDNNITPKEITGDYAWQSGNYYILVKSKDAYGTLWGFSSQYPIVINY